jgi:methionine-rich copper-binding protein CopC
VSRHVSLVALELALVLASPQGAFARTLHMMETVPAAEAIVDGRHAEYRVRFDAPVDHQNSRMTITQGNKVVATLKPRLDAAPTVLYASAPRLPAGDYQLHWAARSSPDGEVTEGSISFKCGLMSDG